MTSSDPSMPDPESTQRGYARSDPVPKPRDPGAAPDDPGATLDLLKKTLKIQDSQRDLLNREITALDKLNGDIEQILKTYTQAFDAIKKDTDALDAYYKAKYGKIACAIGPDVQKKIDAFEDAYTALIAGQEDRVGVARDAMDAARVAADQAQDELEAQQRDFDVSLRVYQKTLTDQVQRAKDWVKKVDDFDAKGKDASAYALLAIPEFRVTPEPPDDFGKELRAAWLSLYKASQAASDLRQKYATAAAEYDAALKALDVLRKNQGPTLVSEAAPYDPDPKAAAARPAAAR
jgi:hypothetical protein